MKHVSFEDVQKVQGDNAKPVFRQIAKIGGFGEVGTNFEGGLDLSGLSDAQNERVAKLLAPEEAPKEEKQKKEGK